MQKDYADYASRVLGVKFKNLEMLVTALTHRSYLNEHRKTAQEHNERLEFLGDAVLEMVVTNHLYENYTEPEGVLTNLRSALVRTESIAEAARKLGVDEYLRLSRGERQSAERAKEQIYANTFEAIVGAIYLDLGYEDAKAFIEKHLLHSLKTILKTGSWIDSKSKLQEEAQQIHGATPSYKVLSEEGPDHEKLFLVGVFIGGKMYGKGEGNSKQIAQQEAAAQALEAISS